MKKIFIGFLVMVMVVAVIFSACAKPAPAPPAPAPPAPAPPAPPPPAPPAPPEVIELTINNHNPPPAAPSVAIDYWAEQVMAQSKGRLKLTVIHGGALLSGAEAYRGIQTGVADGGHYVVDREQGFLLNIVNSLPFMGWPDQKTTGKIYVDLLNKFPEMQAEWQGVKIISVFMMPAVHIHNVKKDIKTPADMKGLLLHCAEAMVAESAKAMGATAVELDIAEMATSLDKKVIDGVVNHFPVLFVFGALEMLPYHTVFGDGGINMTPMFLIINTDVFNKLPPDLQEIIENSGHFWWDKFWEGDQGLLVSTVQSCKDRGDSFVYLTPEQIKAWRDLVKKPVHDAWIAECAAKGLPGKAVYDEALRLIEQYKAK